MILVTLPTGQRRANDACQARTIQLKITLEGTSNEVRFEPVFDVRVLVVEN